MNKLFKLFFTAFFIVFSFIACDKDYNTLGSDIVGNEHFDFYVEEDTTISVENKAITAMQSNNLPINPLGIYTDPYFGKTKAHFATQISLSSAYSDVDATIGILETLEITNKDSIYIYIPFFSNVETTETDGSKTYSIDSLYQSNDVNNQKFKLEIYENKAYLGNDETGTDPRYYYNTAAEYNRIDSQKGEKLGDSIDFSFSKDEIKLYKRNDEGKFVNSSEIEIAYNDVTNRVVKERMAPGLWINLSNKNFFLNNVLKAAHEGKLFNNITFQQYFKGLFFKVTENTAATNAMSLLNFSQGYINIQYHSKIGTATDVTKNTLKLNLSGNTVSVSEFIPSTEYSTALTGTNATDGKRIHIKGGNGSVSYLDIISNEDFVKLREKDVNGNKKMVNEAYLVFYVDQTAMDDANQQEPLRIYLYDATNNRPIIDYSYDGSTTTNSKYNKYIFGGILEKDTTTKKGIKYKVNVTQYIRDIINTDFDIDGDGDVDETDAESKIVKFGLVVTENINIANNYYEEGATGAPLSTYTKIPLGSAMSPFGTVLHGPNSEVASKKLKLEIHYTKPE